MLLNKDQILTADDLPHVDVEVPEWGGSVRVRTMTGQERDAFEAEVFEVSEDKIVAKRENYMARLLVRCLVNENGGRLFTDKEIKALGGKSAKAMRQLFNVAQDLNGMSREAQEDISKK